MSFMKILLTPIAFSSIITNFAVIIIFLRNRVWLTRPYNVFILVLSFTDMITGIVMCITPKTVFVEPIKISNHSFFGPLYCKMLWSRWFLFALGAVSVYTCLFLTIERWTAICRPFKYRTRFASKYLIGFVVLIWFFGLGTSYIGALEFHFVPTNSNRTTPSCKHTPIAPANLIGLVAIMSVSAKFVIPSVIILILYTMAILKIRENDRRLQGQSTRNEALKSVTKMAAIASAVLVLCWLPNQVYCFKFVQNCTFCCASIDNLHNKLNIKSIFKEIWINHQS